MRALASAGIAVALPVAIRLGEPMTFRPWQRGAPMARGIWDIPIPATTTEVVPRTLIAPIVGSIRANYRLGYGGGFFDRTLAKLGSAAQAIGVGFSLFALPTIHPQPHDVAMARIVTEAAPLDFGDERFAGLLSGSKRIPTIGASSPTRILRRRCSRFCRRRCRPSGCRLLDFVLWRLAGASERVRCRDWRPGQCAGISFPPLAAHSR